MQLINSINSMLIRNDEISNSNDNMSSYVRIVHIAAKAPDVDIYINDKPAISALKYREFTNYIKLPSGTYNIKVYPTTKTIAALKDVDIFIAPKSITTLAAFTENSTLNIYPIDETPLLNPTSGKAKIRIAQFIENVPPVDVLLSNGTILYKNVSFKDVRNYIELLTGKYAFKLNLADTDITILYVPNINLKSDKYYTLYLIGLISDYPPPQMLIPLDGISYLKF